MPVSADEHLCVTMCAEVVFRDHKVPLTLSVQPWYGQCSMQEKWTPWAVALKPSVRFKVTAAN